MAGSLDSFLIVCHAPTTVVCQISRNDDLFQTLLLIVVVVVDLPLLRIAVEGVRQPNYLRKSLIG